VLEISLFGGLSSWCRFGSRALPRKEECMVRQIGRWYYPVRSPTLLQSGCDALAFCNKRPNLAELRRESMSNWRTAVCLFLLVLLLVAIGVAQTQPSAAPPTANPQVGAQKGMMMLTIFLKHDQSKPLPKIVSELKTQGYYKEFPPDGVEIVSWYVLMGIGQAITLRFPAERLADVNSAVERTVWGPFRTEFYPTYDFKAIGELRRRENQ